MQGGYWRDSVVVVGRVENDEDKLRGLAWDAQKFDSTFSWDGHNDDFASYRTERGNDIHRSKVAIGGYLLWYPGMDKFRWVSDVELLQSFVSEVTL